LFCTHQSIDLRKETRSCTILYVCGTVGAKIGYVFGLLVHGKVVVDFGRKVFLVSWLLWNNIKYGEYTLNRTL